MSEENHASWGSEIHPNEICETVKDTDGNSGHQTDERIYYVKEEDFSGDEMRMDANQTNAVGSTDRSREGEIRTRTDDEISEIIHSDNCIMALATKLVYTSKEPYTEIRARLREMGRLVLVYGKLEKKCGVHLTDMLRPERFVAVVHAARRVAGCHMDTHRYLKEGVGRSLVHLLKIVCVTEISRALIAGDDIREQKVKGFLDLLYRKWDGAFSEGDLGGHNHGEERTNNKVTENVMEPALVPTDSTVNQLHHTPEEDSEITQDTSKILPDKESTEELTPCISTRQTSMDRPQSAANQNVIQETNSVEHPSPDPMEVGESEAEDFLYMLAGGNSLTFGSQKAEKRRHPLFDIREIICSHPKGERTLNEMDRNRAVSKDNRKVLVHSLVSHLLETHGSNPSADVKAELARLFVETFPYLKDPHGVTGYEAWFLKGSRKNPATGYFEARLRYVRMKSTRGTPVYAAKKAKKSVDESLEKKSRKLLQQKQPGKIFPEEEIEEAISWLEHNSGPQNLVLEKMRKTVHRRQQWINVDKPDPSEILEKFPRLLYPGVVEQDFKETFEASPDALFREWPKIAPSIADYVLKIYPQYRKALSIADGCGENTSISECDSIKDPSSGGVMLSQLEMETLAFSLLPLVLTGKSSKMKGCCGVTERVNSFVRMKPAGTDVAHYLKDTDKDKMTHPHILVVGSRIKPLEVYVVVERRAIQFKTMTEAVDYCLKLIYVLNVQYHPACVGTWEFLQNIYSPEETTVTSSSSVRELRTFLANE